MVKKGRNKKARSSSRQNKALKSSFANAKFKNPNALFRTNSAVKDNWQADKSPLQNLAAMGLKTGLNDDIKKPGGLNSTNTTFAPAAKAIELFDIPADGKIKGHTKRDVMLPVSVDDQTYIVALLKKHGTNYTKAFRDTKLNNMQHTSTKLENLANKFFALTDKEVVVEMGAKVEKLRADAA
ncbi:hypothetical protein TeGR_g9675 [Tetraparma gracilis]|uniref:Nucleolar protein 16 n=1 Tax=Tetraparma gracilis TaxID=2962635 RepID=A0ABQ6MP32_9STRA|nr:hypothetical protein TeGR_g9675 [Tetraparma gracilis]